MFSISGKIRNMYMIFFDVNFERLPWARELHMALSDFFTQYRIHCEVHYVINGRKGESDLINKKGARRKR